MLVPSHDAHRWTRNASRRHFSRAATVSSCLIPEEENALEGGVPPVIAACSVYLYAESEWGIWMAAAASNG